MFKYIQFSIYTVCLLLASGKLLAQSCGNIIGEKSGQVIESGPCEGGLREGEWYFFYDNDKEPEDRVMAKGSYKNGKKHGTWYTYLESKGNCEETIVKEAFTYVNDIKEGPAATFYPDVCDSNKAMKFAGNYNNGKREGLWAHYNKKGSENEHVLKVMNYVNDQVTGKQYDYTHDKEVVYEYTMSEGETELPSVHSDGQIYAKQFDGYLEYYGTLANGRRVVKQRKHYDEAGVPTGLWIDYYGSGRVKEYHTPDSMLSFFPNGKLRQKDHYLEGWRNTIENGEIGSFFNEDSELTSMILSFGARRMWSVSFYPNRSIRRVSIIEPKMSWTLRDDGSIRDIYSYNKKGEQKSKYFKQGKKYPSSPPEWETMTLENANTDLKRKLHTFFEKVKEAQKGSN